MKDPILANFLARQHQEAMELARASDLLELTALPGETPNRYIAFFRARGLVKSPSGSIEEFGEFAVGIWLPENYLLKADPAQVLTYLGPHPHPWHPNIAPPFICLYLRPATPLVSLLYALFETWTWNLWETRDNGLNPAAAQWARAQDPKRFPVDRRPLKRRQLRLEVEPAP